MKPSVSIITPAFNAARLIPQTIESVRAQTFRNWEMLIVDDCSTDETCAVVEHYASADSRIRLICQPENGGPARARNTALKAASGRYITFLDSDDIWLPDKLAHQLAFMQSRNLAFSYTLYRRMSEAGDAVSNVVRLKTSFDYRSLLRNTSIACLTVMLDKTQVGALVMPDIHHEDFALWLDVLKKGFIAHGLQEDLARYRVVKGSVSGMKLKSATWVWNIYRREGLGLIHALWCLICYIWHAYRRRREARPEVIRRQRNYANDKAGW